MIYIYNKNNQQFYRSKYNIIIKELNLPKYLELKPISTTELPEKKARYGSNIIEISSPSFFTLYKEQYHFINYDSIF